MFRILNYYGRFERVRGQWGGLPGWARGTLFIAALPGLILALLSVAAFAVSVGVLLLLAVPVYRLLTAVSRTGGGERRQAVQYPMHAPIPQVDIPAAAPPSGRRHIEVTIIE
jgi:hypothetical protein